MNVNTDGRRNFVKEVLEEGDLEQTIQDCSPAIADEIYSQIAPFARDLVRTGEISSSLLSRQTTWYISEHCMQRGAFREGLEYVALSLGERAAAHEAESMADRAFREKSFELLSQVSAHLSTEQRDAYHIAFGDYYSKQGNTSQAIRCYAQAGHTVGLKRIKREAIERGSIWDVLAVSERLDEGMSEENIVELAVAKAEQSAAGENHTLTQWYERATCLVDTIRETVTVWNNFERYTVRRYAYKATA